jgi:hypothetical protein
MIASAPDWRTIVTRILDSRAASFIGHAADATTVLIDVPLPKGDTVPSMDMCLHHFELLLLFSILQLPQSYKNIHFLFKYYYYLFCCLKLVSWEKPLYWC